MSSFDLMRLLDEKTGKPYIKLADTQGPLKNDYNDKSIRNEKIGKYFSDTDPDCEGAAFE